MTTSQRPYVIAHMMSTIEGKITSADQTDILSNDYFDLYTQFEDRLEAKAWMIGRVTMQMFASAEKTDISSMTPVADNNDFVALHEASHFMFGVDTKGLLRWDKNTIKLSNVDGPLHLVIVVTTATPKEYLGYLQQQQISYLMTGETEIDFNQLFEKIKDKFSVERLLLEGGGKLNGSVMSAGLVDEISLLLTPTVINQSNAPSVFEGKEEKIDLKKYKLLSAQTVDKDVVWLRYTK